MNAFRLGICIILTLSIGGCADLPLKEDGLVIGKDTTASLDEPTVARVTNSF